jgi:DnaJ domain
MANAEPSVAEARMTLGITADATHAQVGSAFRRLARGVHPDVSDRHDAGPRFDALVAAYRIASRSAGGERRSTDDVEAGGNADRPRPERTPPPPGPPGRQSHEVLVGARGTMVWEAGRPVLFVSPATCAPPSRST